MARKLPSDALLRILALWKFHRRTFGYLSHHLGSVSRILRRIFRVNEERRARISSVSFVTKHDPDGRPGPRCRPAFSEIRQDCRVHIRVRLFRSKLEHLREANPGFSERVDNEWLALMKPLESYPYVSSELIAVDWRQDPGISDNHAVRADRHG